MQLSVVIPSLNEAGTIGDTLLALQELRDTGHQIILADGGSVDDTARIASPLVDEIVLSQTGRARQMNAGAGYASGDVILFLHADTRLPANAVSLIQQALRGRRRWGRFNVHLGGTHVLLRVVERMMNWRSCLTGICTGDQAIFVEHELFRHSGGYADIPLMEDIELSRRLRRSGMPACIRTPAWTSSRRWEHYGIVRTILLMWRLRLAYLLGADPVVLAKRYRRSDTQR